jgi:hypothetical protein
MAAKDQKSSISDHALTGVYQLVEAATGINVVAATDRAQRQLNRWAKQAAVETMRLAYIATVKARAKRTTQPTGTTTAQPTKAATNTT